MNGLILLGASGSIGRQTLDVAARAGLRVDAFSVHTNLDAMEEAARRFSPRAVCVTDPDRYAEAKIRLSDTETKLYAGREGLAAMIAASPADTVLNALVGEAGLYPTVWALENKKRLALANKESLVCAGDYVMALAKRQGVSVLPVDSEHCAIHQCLRAGRAEEVKELILTASGGPFFGYDKEALKRVTKSDALRHPTWNMGQKITVDSATMMNKGFELIEAAHLFSLDIRKISVLVHRESVVHSLVRFCDNTVLAQMGVPDMRACIAYALFYPHRPEAFVAPLDLAGVGTLSFARIDSEAFPLPALAVEAFEKGGVMPAVLNAANEEAVAAFLAGKLSFWEISDIISHFVHTYTTVCEATPENVSAASAEVRQAMAARFGK